MRTKSKARFRESARARNPEIISQSQEIGDAILAGLQRSKFNLRERVLEVIEDSDFEKSAPAATLEVLQKMSDKLRGWLDSSQFASLRDPDLMNLVAIHVADDLMDVNREMIAAYQKQIEKWALQSQLKTARVGLPESSRKKRVHVKPLLAESSLRELIREILLTEQASSGKIVSLVQNLENINLELESFGYRVGLSLQRKSSIYAKIVFALKNTESEEIKEVNYYGKVEDLIEKIAADSPDENLQSLKKLEKIIPWGAIDFRQISIDACRTALYGENPFTVVYTSPTLKGWGPLLYDLAIEYATSVGGGLISDRLEVSDDALRVWSAYDLSRPDVTMSQLDIDYETAEENDLQQLTRHSWDDCSQFSALDHLGDDWAESPLSRVATKDPVATELLRSKNLFWD